jgi:hypothetical protein
LTHLTTAYEGYPYEVRTGGLRISFPEADVHSVPKILQGLAEASYYYGRSRQAIYDLQTGKKLVEWESQTQHLMPKPAKAAISAYPHSIAPDGSTVVEGGEGVVTLYQLP